MKLTSLDSKEIPRYTYDEDQNANRVTLVGDFGIAEAIKEQMKDLKLEISPEVKSVYTTPITETRFEQIQVPVIVKEIEYREIKVPVIQTELKVVEIEKPIIQKEVEIQRIEVPIIVREKEIQTVYVDRMNYKMVYIMQAITLALIVLSKFVK
jgi:hypothetical protein